MVNSDELTLGPVNLVPPAISFTDGTNSFLAVTSGLWLYSQNSSFGFQWQKDGVDVPGLTGNQVAVQPGDAGSQFSLRQTASDVNGSRFSESNVVAIAAGGFQDVFDDPDGTLLIDKSEYIGLETAGSARFEIRNSVAQASASSGSEVLQVNAAMADDQWIEFEVAQVGHAVAAMSFWLRRQADGAGYFLNWTGSSMQVRGSYVTGGYAIVNLSHTVQAGDVIRYEVSGSTHRVFVNGSLLPETGTQGSYTSGSAAISVSPTNRDTANDQKIAALRVGDV